MRVHLVDGTYELFRYYFALPGHLDDAGIEVDAVRGVLGSTLGLLEEGATHVGVATDHVIESFRNDLWPGYKTSAGIDPLLLAQFPLLEDALLALGVTVWAMVDLEADDALAAAARVGVDDPRVEQVVICTPDKDLAQCVVDPRVVQLDRRQRKRFDEAAVREKFGVSPASIPDWLALVGDNADGFPGLPGWGAKSAASVLARYGHLEEIPADGGTWNITVRGAPKLAATLAEAHKDAMLFRDLATLRVDAPVGRVDDWRWRGPAPELERWTDRLDAPELLARARTAAEGREP
ncbi:MAG TPA: 5'-3' exonuclease H3TH domain-containing protein [Acidimicrobiia bacterium]|nr:5'-3' exonuclease H3TH domain-containing protein [Acidimicrobiia bacterium]